MITLKLSQGVFARESYNDEMGKEDRPILRVVEDPVKSEPAASTDHTENTDVTELRSSASLSRAEKSSLEIHNYATRTAAERSGQRQPTVEGVKRLESEEFRRRMQQTGKRIGSEGLRGWTTNEPTLARRIANSVFGTLFPDHPHRPRHT